LSAYQVADVEETRVTPTVRIRPVWVVVGAVIFTVCTGVGICAAIFGLGMNAILSGSDYTNSQEVIAGRTDVPTQPVPATVTLAATPSQLPLGGTLPPPPVSGNPISPTFGGIVSDTFEPAQAVRTYYQLVDDNRYDLSWPMLTERFKNEFNCCAPNYNYAGYVQWWDSVDRVEVASTETIQQTGDRAVVAIELHYIMRSGGRSIDRSYILLTRDPATGGWLFDDKTDTL
jgi:hypothetical protein